MNNDTIKIALSKLTPDPMNVRKTYNAEAIAELAASIEANGMVQNIVVRKASKKGHFFVTAGGRRFKALELLAETGKIAKDTEVNCLLRSQEDATEISLAENVMREAMHPADAYEAYAKLEAEGKSVSDIAVKFGTTETMIRRRLLLGKVSPVLRNLFRENEMSYDQLTAFTISDDHDEQERVWSEMQSLYNKDPAQIRSALSGETVKYTDKRIKFIGGINAYEEAGGAVRRDLFDANDGGYALDIVKVETMVAEKFAEIEADVRAEGWSWTLATPTIDFEYAQTLGRKYPETLPLNEADQAELDRLVAEYDEIEKQIESDGEEDEAAEAKLDALEERMDELNRREPVYSPEVMASGGVIISIDMYTGNARIERGFIKPEGQEAEETEQTRAKSNGQSEKAKPFAHSAALIQDLTAQKTAALRVELANNPSVALAAVVHALLLKVVYANAGQSALQISLDSEYLETSMKAHESCRALIDMHQLREGYRYVVPSNPKELWQWCLDRKQDQLLDLLAFAAALSVSAVEHKFNDRQSAFSHANDLGEALNVDMKTWFEPTAANYFSQVNRAGIELAMNEAAGEQAVLAVKAAAKKSEAVLIAELLVKGTGWLPEHIRIKAEPSTEPVGTIDDVEADDENGDNDNADIVMLDQAAE